MFEKITENVENISLLPDTPAMPTDQLKKEFDKGSKIIKEAFNKFINKLNNSIVDKNAEPSKDTIYSSEAVQELIKENYSTEEKVIGTWIDGKPLYRKVVYIDSLPNANFKNVAHNIQNFDIATSIIATGISASKSCYFIPFVGNGYMFGDGTQLAIRVDATNITIYSQDDKTNHKAYVTIEYTKTTN